VFIGITWQVTDLVQHDAFAPGEYFSYFTIQSSMINIVVLAVGGVMALRRGADTELYTRIRASALCYAVMTAAVYNVLLRGLPNTDGHYPGLQWPNEVMHVAIPIYLVLDWLFAPGRAPLRFRALGTVVSYPLAWTAFTLVRGAISGWYPYPFLDPHNGGYLAVSGYVVAIAAFILVIGVVAIAISRRPR
jgi:hypothetical protein